MNNWISVKDKMPDNNKMLNVLVTNGRDTHVAIRWFTNVDPLKTDWSYSDCCGCSADGVTHWMPLPSPPIEI